MTENCKKKKQKKNKLPDLLSLIEQGKTKGVALPLTLGSAALCNCQKAALFASVF